MSDAEPYPLPGWLTDPDTPRAQAGPPRVSISDLMTRGMGALDDDALEQLATAMRDDARATYEYYARWVRTVRARRALGRKSERAAAKGSGVSRAAIRKATSNR